MDSAVIDAVAKAIRAEAESFAIPVDFYVKGEAIRRWEKLNPDGHPYDDCPDVDWDFESWKILARVALSVIEGIDSNSET